MSNFIPFVKSKEGLYIKNCLVDNYSREALEAIVKRSKSMAELVRNLGYATSHGRNHNTVNKRLIEYNISTEHFKSTPSQRVISESDVFCSNSTVSQSTLRRFYIKTDVEYKCSKCGLEPLWNNGPLTLQLDHIDGDNNNNLMSNLRWLCPNCHSQTKTFAGKNNESKKTLFSRKSYCIDCGIEITGQSERCHKCASVLRQKINRPSKDDLETLIKSHNGNFTSVAKIYGVTDNSVRKWCNSYDLPTHSKDYKNSKPKNTGHSPIIIPVDQIDISTGTVIKTFPSIREAETITGISHIYDASNPNNSRQSAGGFYWRRHEAKPFY